MSNGPPACIGLTESRMKADDLRLSLTPRDVAEALDVDRLTATRLMAGGSIRSVDVGKGGRHHWRTCRAWLAAFQAGGETVGSSTTDNGRQAATTIANHG